MRISDIQKIIKESDAAEENKTVQDAPPPGDMNEWITTAQRAKILGVSMSRIRQFIGEGRLKSKRPVPGKRDNFLKRSEVETFKDKERKITGRPEESKTDKE